MEKRPMKDVLKAYQGAGRRSETGRKKEEQTNGTDEEYSRVQA